MALVTWNVISPDMWGHVAADCAEHGCPCVGYEPDAGDGSPREACDHDDNACECSEWENGRFKSGVIEAQEDASDKELIKLLYEGGFLTREGKDVAKVEDYSDGYEVDVVDDAGRKLFVLQKVEL